MKMKSYAKVSTEFRGTHRFASVDQMTAEEIPTYLGNRHHHWFTVQVQIEQFHTNRDVEYHQLIDIIDDIIDSQYGSRRVKELSGLSCEDIALTIIQKLTDIYSGRDIIVTILEDERCGAVLRIVAED